MIDYILLLSNLLLEDWGGAGCHIPRRPCDALLKLGNRHQVSRHYIPNLIFWNLEDYTLSPSSSKTPGVVLRSSIKKRGGLEIRQ